MTEHTGCSSFETLGYPPNLFQLFLFKIKFLGRHVSKDRLGLTVVTNMPSISVAYMSKGFCMSVTGGQRGWVWGVTQCSD